MTRGEINEANDRLDALALTENATVSEPARAQELGASPRAYDGFSACDGHLAIVFVVNHEERPLHGPRDSLRLRLFDGDAEPRAEPLVDPASNGFGQAERA